MSQRAARGRRCPGGAAFQRPVAGARSLRSTLAGWRRRTRHGLPLGEFYSVFVWTQVNSEAPGTQRSGWKNWILNVLAPKCRFSVWAEGEKQQGFQPAPAAGRPLVPSPAPRLQQDLKPTQAERPAGPRGEHVFAKLQGALKSHPTRQPLHGLSPTCAWSYVILT